MNFNSKGKKMLRTILILGLIFVSSTVFAGTKEDIGKCAANNSDALRLICYDDLAILLGVDKPITKVTTGEGKWLVREIRSPIDDSVNVYVSITANETVKSGYNKVSPELYMRCKENETNVYLTWNLYLGSEQIKMLTRFDKLKANKDGWAVSTDYKTVFLIGSNIEYIKKIMKHDKLLTQITPYGESPVMATFDVSGLSEAIKPLRKACHW